MEQYRLLRNLVLQYLEENLSRLKEDQEKVIQEILQRLKENGYELTPDIEDYVKEVISQNVNLIKALIARSAFLATRHLGIPQKTQEVLKEIEDYEYPDGLNLSKRLWKRERELKRLFKSVLFKSLRDRESAKKIAYEFQYKAEREPFEPLTKEELPELIKKLEDTALRAITDRETRGEWQKIIRRYKSYVEQRSKLGTYYAHKKLLNDLTQAVENLSEKMVKDAIKWWAYDKQLYYLNRIARTEVSNVIHLSILKETEKDPYIVGYRWELSPAHRRPDICDHLANVEFGLGKGVFPKGRVPRRKPHPHCTCHITPVAGDPKKTKVKEKPLKELIRENPQIYEEWIRTRKWASKLLDKGVPLEEFFDRKTLRMKTREEMKEWEKKADLVKVLGVNKKLGLKAGDKIEHPIHGFKTKVVAVYEDLLGNEKILTEHTKRHINLRLKRREAKWRKPVRKWALENVHVILKDPHAILEDIHGQSLLYVRVVRHGGVKRWASVVVKKDSDYFIRTCQPMADLDKERYIKIYEVGNIEHDIIEIDR